MLEANQSTLVRALDRAAKHPDGHGLRFLDRRERPTFYSWTQVQQRALRVCGGLQALGIQPGERVALVYPTCIEFFDAFFGVLLAGAVPSPLYPPVRLGRAQEYHARSAAMIEALSARLVLAGPRVRRVLGETIAIARPALGCQRLEDLPSHPAAPCDPDPEALAMVQFSSGTTVHPKPVALTHRAVMSQARVVELSFQDRHEVAHSGVSWLPLYHDMGLIGCVFPSVLHPTTLTLMGPELFITRPAAWLRAMSTYKATSSTAPNFAYSLCLQRIKDSQMEGVDLSSWRVAMNGAEPVAPEVLRRFNERFAQWGLRPEALTPVYGLSEASLAVTFSDFDTPFRSECFDLDALSRDRAVPAKQGQEIVSVGRPVPHFEVQVRDAQQEPLPEGWVGRVWVRGPSLMRGYLGRPEATAAALVDGWLDTGDLGFLYEEELFLTGRAKDVLILRGRNHAPHLVEQSVDDLAGVRTGCAVAVSWRPEGAETEALALFVEHTQDAPDAVRDAMPEACAAQVLQRTGLACDLLVVLPPGTLPRTSSGKLRRAESLRRYEAGELTPPDKVTPLRVAGLLARSAMGFVRSRGGA